MVDGGFRRGREIMIALGLGASGVLLGRAYAFGLSAQGQEGIEKAISILADEITTTLKLMGLNSIKELQAKGPECACQIAEADDDAQPVGVKVATSRWLAPAYQSFAQVTFPRSFWVLRSTTRQGAPGSIPSILATVSVASVARI